MSCILCNIATAMYINNKSSYFFFKKKGRKNYYIANENCLVIAPRWNPNFKENIVEHSHNRDTDNKLKINNNVMKWTNPQK